MLIGENAGVYVLNYKDNDDESKVSLEVGDTKSKVVIQKEDEQYAIKVQVSITGVVGEISNNKVEMSTKAKLDEFKKQAEVQLKEELNTFIKKVQKDFGSDIFGFGERFKNKYPDVFKKIENNWNSVFTSLDIDVEVKVNITGTALSKQPFHKED